MFAWATESKALSAVVMSATTFCFVSHSLCQKSKKINTLHMVSYLGSEPFPRKRGDQFDLLTTDSKKQRGICLSAFWCRWSGSNRYGIATTGFWVQHVCQFHHTGIFNWTSVIITQNRVFVKSFLSIFEKKFDTMTCSAMEPYRQIVFSRRRVSYFKTKNPSRLRWIFGAGNQIRTDDPTFAKQTR